MNREQVQAYLSGPGKDEEDLVVMPRKVFRLVTRKDIGAPAEAILEHLAGISLHKDRNLYYPVRESDFLSCLALVTEFPELRPRIYEMADVSPWWAVIVSHWDELENVWQTGRKYVFGAKSDFSKAWEKVALELDQEGLGSK